MHKTPIVIIFTALALVGLPMILPLPFSSLQVAAVGTTGTTDIAFKTTTLTAEEGSKVKITLTAPANLTQVTKVRLKVTGGTARSGTDFRIPTTQNITFYRGGLREKSVTLTLNSDSTQESPETIIFGLFSQQGQSLNKTLTVTVTDKGASNQTITTAIDLNAVPTDTTLDANGWPRYLRVPETCARPAAGKKYIFEPRLGNHPRNNFSNTFIAPLLTSGFGASTGDFVINLTDNEVMAIPFYAPYLASVGETPKTKMEIAELGNNAFGYATQYWLPHAAYGNQMQIRISRCPGGENPIVTSGPGAAGALITGITIDGEQTRTVNGKNLNQGERYFINIKGTCTRDFSDPTYTTGIYARNGKPLCASITQSYGSYQGTVVPPYTGGVLTQGPYPINYNYKTIAVSNGYEGNDTYRWRCFDVTGKGEEMRYEITNRGWTEPNKPAYQNYVCAMAQNKSFEEVPVYQVCAEHSLGYTRISRVSIFDIPLQHVDSCQFDSTKKVYFWKTITPSSSSNALLDQNTEAGKFNFIQAWNGTPGTVEYKDANGTLIKSERFH